MSIGRGGKSLMPIGIGGSGRQASISHDKFSHSEMPERREREKLYANFSA